jgi:hypothetical protein
MLSKEVKRMHKSFGLLAATALIAAALGGSAFAQDRSKDAKDSKTLVICDGGVQEGILTNTENALFSTASAVAVAIPGTTIPGGASGAAGDSDLYTITLSGEASATSGGSWTAQAQVSVNGGAFVNINPVGPNTFHSGNKAQTHTMTWCTRVVATASTSFRVVWAKIGGGLAQLDDYTMRVERSN